MTKKNTVYALVNSAIHGEQVLLAVTRGSTNTKTGNMAQVYILHPDDYPQAISNAKKDDRVCGECPLRHSKGGACYVVLFQGPRATYQGWLNTNKRIDELQEIYDLVKDRPVRFGAYGDPAHIPAGIVDEVMKSCSGWTAFTHQWRNPVVAATWKGKAMASCDSVGQLRTAQKVGWSGFLVAPEDAEGATLCNNERTGQSCELCLRCDGSKGSVRITPHGARQKRHPSMKRKT